MSKDEENSVLIALLEDASEHVIPRLRSLQQQLKAGSDLTPNDTLFCSETLEKLRFCLGGAGDDPECERIFAQIAHQLFEVVSLASGRSAQTA